MKTGEEIWLREKGGYWVGKKAISFIKDMRIKSSVLYMMFEVPIGHTNVCHLSSK